MDKIEWSDDFSVGVKLFDEQHKRLISIVNKLIDASNATVDSEIISEILTEMTDYALTHFKDEEKYMKEYDYPEYEAHKKQHKEFLKKTIAFCDATIYKDRTVPQKILIYLTDWWVNHIQKVDKQYGTFFNQEGVY